MEVPEDLQAQGRAWWRPFPGLCREASRVWLPLRGLPDPAAHSSLSPSSGHAGSPASCWAWLCMCPQHHRVIRAFGWHHCGWLVERAQSQGAASRSLPATSLPSEWPQCMRPRGSGLLNGSDELRTLSTEDTAHRCVPRCRFPSLQHHRSAGPAWASARPGDTEGLVGAHSFARGEASAPACGRLRGRGPRPAPPGSRSSFGHRLTAASSALAPAGPCIPGGHPRAERC